MRLIAVLAAALLLPLLSMDVFAQADSKGITVTQPWSRATPGGVRTGGAYLQITASDEAGDRLVDARSGAAERVELHTHIHEDGVMKMRRVEAIDVPAGKTVSLAPGGYHLMLMNLEQPLREGDTLDLTLVFEKAGEIEVTATVEPIGAKGPGGAAATGHNAGHHGEAKHEH